MKKLLVCSISLIAATVALPAVAKIPPLRVIESFTCLSGLELKKGDFKKVSRNKYVSKDSVSAMLANQLVKQTQFIKVKSKNSSAAKKAAYKKVLQDNAFSSCLHHSESFKSSALSKSQNKSDIIVKSKNLRGSLHLDSKLIKKMSNSFNKKFTWDCHYNHKNIICKRSKK